ncbi:MAG: DUF1073 domain-containing protein, partial [Hyphomicrobiaceae bacterium]
MRMTAIKTLTNALQRNIARVLPGWGMGSAKHNHACDFGWPEQISFSQFYRAYCRNGLASAAVDKTVAKTWETMPVLWETEKPAESQLEADVAKHFQNRRIWQSLMNADRRSMVGAYAGAILILADGKALDQPVDRVPGNIEGLVRIIPAWQGQLKVAEYDNIQTSPTYGEPKFFSFEESEMMDGGGRRQVKVHPDRVIIWSEDGTVSGRSALEPGFNDLIDAEKVKGAGGEGFWKTSRGAPLITAPDGMSLEEVVKGMGAVDVPEAMDKINSQLEDFQSGFDKGLMLGGMNAEPLTITLPQPEGFFNIPVQSFAASMQMPVRILIGNQTGERASTEDSREWAQTNMSRRENICLPLIRELVARLVRWGILPERDWTVGWDDLTEATAGEKMDR